MLRTLKKQAKRKNYVFTYICRYQEDIGYNRSKIIAYLFRTTIRRNKANGTQHDVYIYVVI